MMITQRSSETGRYYAVVSGKVSFDAKYEETQFGPKCTFPVNFESWQDEQKKWHNKSISCRCTGELAAKASYLEKKDVVLVTGYIRETSFTDKRTGEQKHWTELVCDNVILPQTPQSAGLAPTDEDIPEEFEGDIDYQLPF